MIMDIKDFAELIKRKRDRLDSMMRRKMPVMVGRMAKDHFQDNFRQGGLLMAVFTLGQNPNGCPREVPMPPAIMERCSPAGSICSNRSDIHPPTTG